MNHSLALYESSFPKSIVFRFSSGSAPRKIELSVKTVVAKGRRVTASINPVLRKAWGWLTKTVWPKVDSAISRLKDVGTQFRTRAKSLIDAISEKAYALARKVYRGAELISRKAAAIFNPIIKFVSPIITRIAKRFSPAVKAFVIVALKQFIMSAIRFVDSQVGSYLSLTVPNFVVVIYDTWKVRIINEATVDKIFEWLVAAWRKLTRNRVRLTPAIRKEKYSEAIAKARLANRHRARIKA